ncbi:MAG: hypothetical protein U0Q11_02385 [Vicinamibacterales bacterium]
MSALDAEIDALYALPLSEFTIARNALAKRLKGTDGATIKALEKPTAIPFAVNQLYWHERRAFTALMAAGQALRRAQLAALSGKSGDVSAAQAAHRQALNTAVTAASRAAEERGTKPQAEPLMRMLEAISLLPEPPSPPGRLVDLVQPAGFEAFASLAAALPARPSAGPATVLTHTPRKAAREDAESKERRRAEEAAARSAAEAAVERATKELEQARANEQRAQALVDLVQQQLDTATRSLHDAAATVSRCQASLIAAESALSTLPRSHRDR